MAEGGVTVPVRSYVLGLMQSRAAGPRGELGNALGCHRRAGWGVRSRSRVNRRRLGGRGSEGSQKKGVAAGMGSSGQP